MRYFSLCFFLCGVLSCGAARTEFYIDYDSFPEPERAFLSALVNDAAWERAGVFFAGRAGRETIRVGFARRRTTWRESEARSNNADEFLAGSSLREGAFLPLSRICYVYAAEVWENKTRAPGDFDEEVLLDLSSLPEGLIPLADLAPPFIACKAGGLDVADPDYPLVYEGGLLFRYRGGREAEAAEKIAALSRLVEEKAQAVSADAAGPESLAPSSESNAEQFFRREERPRLFRIASGGDVMLGRGVEAIFLAESPEGVLGGTAASAASADLALVNLEGAVTAAGEKEAAKKTYVFRFDPRVAPALKRAGFDAALIANNHAFDYGMTGFLDSIRHLEEAGIPVLGAGRNAAAAASPFVMDGPSFPVKVFGIASFGKELNGWDGLLFAADEDKPGMLHAGKRGAELIKNQLDKNAFNIIYFHGGVEYTDYPDDETRALYTDLIRAGADLVIGTHPHVEQGFEWVEGKPVFWSLGDYVFDEMDDTPGGDKGIFVVLSYAGRVLVHVDVYPVFMNGPRTIVSPPEQLARFFRLTKNLARSAIPRP